MKKMPFITSLFILAASPVMAGTSAQVEYGTVQQSRLVTKTSESASQGAKPLRTIGGAALGAVVGNQFGGGSGKTIATATGAIAGAELSRRRQGTQTEPKTQQSVELQIKTDSGKLINVVQDQDPQLSFNKGDRVRILTSGSDTSVDKSVVTN